MREVRKIRELSVLIVDDESSIRALMRDIFSMSLNWRTIVSTQNAELALEAMKGQKFDLLFTDRQMPGILGEELASRAKVVYPNIKIILMSGDDPDEFERVALAAGADRVLRKPAQLFQIEKTIGELFPE